MFAEGVMCGLEHLPPRTLPAARHPLLPPLPFSGLGHFPVLCVSTLLGQLLAEAPRSTLTGFPPSHLSPPQAALPHTSAALFSKNSAFMLCTLLSGKPPGRACSADNGGDGGQVSR